MYAHPKYFALVFLLVSALLQQPASRSRQATDTNRLETVWNEAYLRGDADTVSRLCGDDLIVSISEMPPLTKADSLRILRSGPVKFKRYETLRRSHSGFMTTLPLSLDDFNERGKLKEMMSMTLGDLQRCTSATVAGRLSRGTPQ